MEKENEIQPVITEPEDKPSEENPVIDQPIEEAPPVQEGPGEEPGEILPEPELIPDGIKEPK